MSDFLRAAAVASHRRVEIAREHVPLASLKEATSCPVPLSIPQHRFGLIGEIKRMSPSEGNLARAGLSLEDQITEYDTGGTCAISVLTEPDHFGGSLSDLAYAAKHSASPVMRKDFLVDAYQVYQGAAHGASGTLLIVGLAPEQHQAMIDAAAATGCFLLFEAFDLPEFDRAVALAEQAASAGVTPLLGVNSRNLETLQVDRARFELFANALPSEWPTIAESGLHTAETIRSIADLGYRGALVGTALMHSDRPRELARSMIASGNAGREQCA